MSKTFYRIIDEKGNYVDKYSFQKESQGKGIKPKWWYFSETNYMSGRVLYPNATNNIIKVYNYLIHISEKLGLNKQFKIVPLNIENLKCDGKILSEELIIN